MPFNRLVADSSATYEFICSKDTGIHLPELPEWKAFKKPETLVAAFLAHVKEQGLLHDSFEMGIEHFQRLEAKKDDEGKEVKDAKGEAVMEDVYWDIDTCRDFMKSYYPEMRFAAYRRTGEQRFLGKLDDDVIVWKMSMLRPADRARVKGQTQDRPDALSPGENSYKLGCFILSKILKGAKGWDRFKIDPKTKNIARDVLATLDEDWVTELASFAFELPDLRADEKKASG